MLRLGCGSPPPWGPSGAPGAVAIATRAPESRGSTRPRSSSSTGSGPGARRAPPPRGQEAGLSAARHLAAAERSGPAAAAEPVAGRRGSLRDRNRPLDANLWSGPRPLRGGGRSAAVDRMVDPPCRRRPLVSARPRSPVDRDRLRPRRLARGVPQPAEHEDLEQARSSPTTSRSCTENGRLPRSRLRRRTASGSSASTRARGCAASTSAPGSAYDRRRAAGSRRGRRARAGRRQHQLRRGHVLPDREHAVRDGDRLGRPRGRSRRKLPGDP